MNKEQIVCIGHNENALLFNSSGIRGIVSSKENFVNEVNKLIENDIKILLVSTHFIDEVTYIREELGLVYPIIVLLALDGTVYEDGVEQIRRDVERATGINIFQGGL